MAFAVNAFCYFFHKLTFTSCRKPVLEIGTSKSGPRFPLAIGFPFALTESGDLACWEIFRSLLLSCQT